MAQYKVPQDVEADDKLLGPFSFRQFVYLMIIGGLVAIGFLLWQIFPLLILILVPPILLLGALALPLKKDQPMETYLAAIVTYHLKPHTRVWEPGEPEATIIITAPKKTDEVHLKDISQEEATHRLSFLADIVDTEGYAIKGGGIKEDIYAEANNTKDIFEMAQTSTLNQALQSNANTHHEELVNQMREAIERNNAFTANNTTIGHHFNNPQVQPLNQPSPYTTQPMPMNNSFNTITPTPMPQPTVSTSFSEASNPFNQNPVSTTNSAIIQPDLPIPETAVPPSYNEQMAEKSEYLPEDEIERLEGKDVHHEDEQQQVDYYEDQISNDDGDRSESEPESEPEPQSEPENEPESESEEPQSEFEPEPESESEEPQDESKSESEPEPEPEPQPSQEMIDLANNPDFSIETIAQQANRISEIDNNKDEVYVSLH